MVMKKWLAIFSLDVPFREKCIFRITESVSIFDLNYLVLK